MENPNLSQRKKESQDLINSHPGKIPVIIKPESSIRNHFQIQQSRFLVPSLYSFHEFIFLIRKRLQLKQSESLYISVGLNSFPSLSRSLSSIYSEYKDPDGFLYMNYSSEATWGTHDVIVY